MSSQGTEIEKKVYAAILEDKTIYILDAEEVQPLLDRGYGEKDHGRFELSPYEALYLLSEGWLTIQMNNATLDFAGVLNHFRRSNPTIWARYMVYRDLRERGYIVKSGFGLGVDFRVYERGAFGEQPAKFIIYGVFEGEPLSITTLLNAVNSAQNLKKEMILGVIERRGEIVYYSINSMTEIS